MEYLVTAIITVASIGFVSYPMFSRNRHLLELESIFEFGDGRQRRYLESKKAAILDNMRELDFELEIGTLSREDYSRLRQDYLQQAQEAVQELDNLRVREEIEELIENDVRSRRRIT